MEEFVLHVLSWCGWLCRSGGKEHIHQVIRLGESLRGLFAWVVAFRIDTANRAGPFGPAFLPGRAKGPLPAAAPRWSGQGESEQPFLLSLHHLLSVSAILRRTELYKNKNKSGVLVIISLHLSKSQFLHRKNFQCNLPEY